MTDISTIATQDGHWLSKCLRTGLVASGCTRDAAIAELARLRTARA